MEGFLGESLDFQDTATEFATFPAVYDALFLARVDGEAMGACGIKPFRDGICELKRLYVLPQGRGHGLGRKLTEMAITEARELGYNRIYLDTDRGLTHANTIYEALGFTDIGVYYDSPRAERSRYMALDL